MPHSPASLLSRVLPWQHELGLHARGWERHQSMDSSRAYGHVRECMGGSQQDQKTYPDEPCANKWLWLKLLLLYSRMHTHTHAHMSTHALWREYPLFLPCILSEEGQVVTVTPPFPWEVWETLWYHILCILAVDVPPRSGSWPWCSLEGWGLRACRLGEGIKESPVPKLACGTCSEFCNRGNGNKEIASPKSW